MPDLDEKNTFTVDGVDYYFTVEKQLAGGNQSIDIYYDNGDAPEDCHVANAYVDHNVEQITVDVFLNEDVTSANYFELGDSPEKVAEYVVAIA